MKKEVYITEKMKDLSEKYENSAQLTKLYNKDKITNDKRLRIIEI